MNEQYDPNIHYTFEEARLVLDRKKSTFYHEIEQGKIPYILPKGKKIGMLFPKKAIDTIARRERKTRKQMHTVHLSFEPSTIADLWVAVDNAQRVYGPDDSIGFDRALEWRDINPDISMSAHDGKQLAGMITLLPIDEQIANELLRDTIRERDIPLQAIRRWTDPALSVYAAGIAIIPSGNAERDRQRGRFLLAHAVRWAITLSWQYDIKNWYGIGVTTDGRDILERLGFHEILSLEGGARKGYVLDSMLKEPTKLIQRFLQRMEPLE